VFDLIVGVGGVSTDLASSRISDYHISPLAGHLQQGVIIVGP